MAELLRPMRGCLIALWAILVLSLVLEFTLGALYYPFANVILPSGILISCGLSAYLLVRKHNIHFFLPIFWYLCASAVYFGFGALYPVFGDEWGMYKFELFVSIEPATLYFSNLVNLLGLSVLFTFLYLFSMWLPGSTAELEYGDKDLPTIRKYAIFFLVVGGSFKYLLVLPYHLGNLGFVLPGSLMNLSAMGDACSLLLAFLSARLAGRWRVAFIILFCFELAIGFLILSKAILLSTILFSLAGYFLARPRLRYLMIGALGLILTYVVIKPLISEARYLLVQRGGRSSASLGTRADIVRESFQDPGGDDRQLGKFGRHYGWWMRLCYSSVQIYAINRRADGVRFDTFNNILFIFVPRFLYPDKPYMTTMGFDFNEMVFGFRSSSLGLSPYAEAYWNGGISVVVLTGIYLGFLFSLLFWFTHWIMHKKLLHLLPILLQILLVSLNVMGWFVPTYMGGMVVLLALTVVFHFGYKILVGSSSLVGSSASTRRGPLRF